VDLVVQPPTPSPQDPRRAVLWHNGVAQDLHALIPQAIGTRAVAINAAGSVGVEMVTPFSAKPLGCYLIRNGVSQQLASADDTSCYLAGVADDDSVLVEHFHDSFCTPGLAQTQGCTPSRHHFALWRQGVPTDFQAEFAELTADGTVWLQTGYTGNMQLTRWRNGVSEPITLNITGLPTGTNARYIPAFNTKGQMLWNGDAVNGKPVVVRHGLLTPTP